MINPLGIKGTWIAPIMKDPPLFYALRFFVTFNVLAYMTGVIILILKKFRINYMYIFEISNGGQMSKFSLLIFSMWISLGFFAIKAIHLTFNTATTWLLRLILLSAFTLIMWFIPIRKLHNIRSSVNMLIAQYWLAPFGKTGFAEIIFGTCLITLRYFMQDFCYLICLYTSGAFMNGIAPTCPITKDYAVNFLNVSVYWWCSMQRAKRVYLNPTLYN